MVALKLASGSRKLSSRVQNPTVVSGRVNAIQQARSKVQYYTASKKYDKEAKEYVDALNVINQNFELGNQYNINETGQIVLRGSDGEPSELISSNPQLLRERYESGYYKDYFKENPKSKQEVDKWYYENVILKEEADFLSSSQNLKSQAGKYYGNYGLSRYDVAAQNLVEQRKLQQQERLKALQNIQEEEMKYYEDQLGTLKQEKTAGGLSYYDILYNPEFERERDESGNLIKVYKKEQQPFSNIQSDRYTKVERPQQYTPYELIFSDGRLIKEVKKEAYIQSKQKGGLVKYYDIGIYEPEKYEYNPEGYLVNKVSQRVSRTSHDESGYTQGISLRSQQMFQNGYKISAIGVRPMDVRITKPLNTSNNMVSSISAPLMPSLSLPKGMNNLSLPKGMLNSLSSKAPTPQPVVKYGSWRSGIKTVKKTKINDFWF